MARSGTLLSLITTDVSMRVAAAAGMSLADFQDANKSKIWPSKSAYDRARRAAKKLAAEAQG